MEVGKLKGGEGSSSLRNNNNYQIMIISYGREYRDSEMPGTIGIGYFM